MFHGQMLPCQMSSTQLPTYTDGLTNKLSKFGWDLTSNIRDMISLVISIIGTPSQKKFANPVVDITAWSRDGVLIWLVGMLGLGCSLTEKKMIKNHQQCDSIKFYWPTLGKIYPQQNLLRVLCHLNSFKLAKQKK